MWERVYISCVSNEFSWAQKDNKFDVYCDMNIHIVYEDWRIFSNDFIKDFVS